MLKIYWIEMILFFFISNENVKLKLFVLECQLVNIIFSKKMCPGGLGCWILNLDFLKVLSNNSWVWVRHYIAQARPRDFVTREIRSTFALARPCDIVTREIQ